MIVVPINPNSIHVPLVQTGCLKSEFDSTYPIHLNGIIRQDEFQESINNINQTISSRKSVIIIGVIFILCMVGGITLFIVGGITAVNSRTRGFPLLIGIGVGVFVLGILIMSVGCCIIQTRRSTRMRKAIANESMKYCTRSPTPCSWRLDVSSYWAGGYGRNRRRGLLYKLIIDIGNSGVPGTGNMPYQFNQMAPPSAPAFSQKNDMLPPPPYYGQSAPGFCFRCGAPRQNPMARFCPSCGQPFNA